MTPLGSDLMTDGAGTAGILLAAQLPYMDSAEAGVRLLAGLAGLILLYWSIRHKILIVQEMRAKKRTGKKPDGEGDKPDADN